MGNNNIQQYRRMRFRREIPLHLMLLPGIVLVLIFNYVPMAGLVIAFQKFIPARGLFGDQKWIGMGNFEYIFSMPNAISVIKNTVLIALGKIIGGMLVPIAVSLLLNEVRQQRLKKAIQTIIYFPNFISWIVMAGIMVDLLSPSTGIVNMLIKALGFEPMFFLGSNAYFRGTMIVTDIWKGFGFGSVIYLATITGIDPTLYEAAAIDGATRARQIWHVTLPGMRMIIVLMTVLNLGNVLNAGFDQIYNLYSPAVYETGDILDTFIYRIGLMNYQFGSATAMGLFKSVISMVLISSSYWIAWKFFDYRIF